MQMAESKLLPCPFCGGEAKVHNWGHSPNLNSILCKNCFVETHTYSTKEAAITAWNTRTNTIPVGNGKDYTVVNE